MDVLEDCEEASDKNDARSGHCPLLLLEEPDLFIPRSAIYCLFVVTQAHLRLSVSSARPGPRDFTAYLTPSCCDDVQKHHSPLTMSSSLARRFVTERHASGLPQFVKQERA